MDLAKVTLVGRVQPGNPEQRFRDDGSVVTSFRMVCGRVRKGRDGEKIEEADWFQVSTFGRLAETVATLLVKGSRVLVEGRFSSREWTDKEGRTRTSLEVLANDVLLLDPRERQESTGSAREGEVNLEDLPF